MRKTLVTLLLIHLSVGLALLLQSRLSAFLPLHFPTIEDFLPNSIPSVPDSFWTLLSQESSQWSDSLPPLTIYIPQEDTEKKTLFLLLHQQPFTKPIVSIENPRVLYPFFEKLFEYHSGKRTEEMHIAFFGDSQIEGDRVTHAFRELIHRHWGGKGIGHVPFYEPATHNHIQERSWSPNWYYHTIFLKRAKTNQYGASGYLFYYILSDSFPTAEFSIRLKPYTGFEKILLSYGHLERPLPYQICYADTCLRDTLPPAVAEAGLHPLPIPIGVKAFRLRFTVSPSPHFYGLYFNGSEGIQVDNYGIRGHAGQGWKHVDGTYLASQLRALNTQLIILEYGGNAIPGIKPNPADSVTEKDLEWFNQGYAQLLSYFKAHVPDIPILIIGVGDMAQVTANRVIPYASVPIIRNIQRRLAYQYDCAFFDLLEAMGGPGSIIQWAHLNPPLAAQDYSHFSHYGQRAVAKLLFNALHYEYLHYAKNRYEAME